MFTDQRLRYTDYPRDWERYNFVWTVIHPRQMTADQLDQGLYRVRHRRIHTPLFSARHMLSTLRRTRNLQTALVAHGFNTGMHQIGRALIENAPAAARAE